VNSENDNAPHAGGGSGPTSARVRILALLLSLVLAVLLLEVVLQALSYGAYLKVQKDSETAPIDSENLIVCVGDSYTFGLGASAIEKSYPHQLEQILDERLEEDWQVVTVCTPGWNSEQMCREFSQFLTGQDPDYVVAIGAVNDGWSGATKHDFAELSALASGEKTEEPIKESFSVEWRTAKFFRTLRQKDAFAVKSNSEVVAADLEVATEEEAEPSSPEAAPNDLQTMPRSQLAAEAWRLLGDSEFALATPLFEDRPELFDLPDQILGLIRCYQGLGRIEEMEEQLSLLLSTYEADPKVKTGQLVLAALHDTKNRELLREIGPRIAEDFPDDFEIMFRAGMAVFDIGDGDVALARKYYERCVELLDGKTSEEKLETWFWAERSDAYSVRTSSQEEVPPVPAILLDSLINSMRSGATDAQVLQKLQFARKILNPTLFEEAVDRSDFDADLKVRLWAAFEGSRRDDLEAHGADVTEHNFRLLSRLAKQKGARVLLSTYPFYNEPLRNAQKSASKQEKTLFLRSDDDFLKVVLEEGRDAVFISDGHCNDRGYMMMAEQIAERLMKDIAEQKAKAAAAN